MPFLKLNTNSVLDTELKSKLLGELSQLVPKETGKPERYVMISIEQNDAMLFAGSTAPLAYLECKSIGLSSSQAKNLSASICQLLNTRLSIPQDRIYIEFSNCPADFWGWNGSTFG
ncbi:phenylpyruvate tautomerase MIF-related protein [Methylomonas sp. OY6]|uniref:L-dopachrome isomerase n=1 Tax=Methylomonas defluvii TaxID=3045149 RepID=A0ABU4UHL4_9GAMM|nr:phenylpyruvate tautomerase MIF-related protein [Methylomonas sp. OY6]MDX8128883.1 phenylpyruvate tautomerase MIF-related protein [Methylomonas sp. OY6]